MNEEGDTVHSITEHNCWVIGSEYLQLYYMLPNSCLRKVHLKSTLWASFLIQTTGFLTRRTSHLLQSNSTFFLSESLRIFFVLWPIPLLCSPSPTTLPSLFSPSVPSFTFLLMTLANTSPVLWKSGAFPQAEHERTSVFQSPSEKWHPDLLAVNHHEWAKQLQKWWAWNNILEAEQKIIILNPLHIGGNEDPEGKVVGLRSPSQWGQLCHCPQACVISRSYHPIVQGQGRYHSIFGLWMPTASFIIS